MWFYHFLIVKGHWDGNNLESISKKFGVSWDRSRRAWDSEVGISPKLWGFPLSGNSLVIHSSANSSDSPGESIFPERCQPDKIVFKSTKVIIVQELIISRREVRRFHARCSWCTLGLASQVCRCETCTCPWLSYGHSSAWGWGYTHLSKSSLWWGEEENASTLIFSQGSALVEYYGSTQWIHSWTMNYFFPSFRHVLPKRSNYANYV